MRLLSWLLGSSEPHERSSDDTMKWGVSENGNAMVILGSNRITVFPQDRGWKYCIAKTSGRGEPYFSDTYENEQQARKEAIADLRGEPSRHATLSEVRIRNRRQQKGAEIERCLGERSQTIDELQIQLANNPELGITGLRKLEATVARQLKEVNWQIDECNRFELSTKLTAMMERQKSSLLGLHDDIAKRIAAKQPQRPKRKQPISASELSDDLASTVDDIIALFHASPVLPENERRRRWATASRHAMEKMLDKDTSYGQASGAPSSHNQDEISFQGLIKKADQNLKLQCEMLKDSFEQHQQTGETPAPHYPMRIAILLRRANDYDRERKFLAAWCKHFLSGNGSTYGKLVERARKTGAIV